MCGIAGYFLRPGQSAPDGFLAGLEAALRHRGPDGTGREVMEGAGFCHTRLSIVDIKGGAQPFVQDKDGRRSMAVANGEIYNHEALRGELPAGTRPGASDCAVLLPLWIAHGGEFARGLRGMYAAALYEEGADGSGDGCLVRDPFGIKPLYYVEDSRGVFFASEMAGLRDALGLAGEPDDASLAGVLDRQFVPGGETAFSDVGRLAPGEVLEIRAGRIARRLKDAPLKDGDGGDPDPDHLDSLLESTVEAHQMSDVPFGMFLSGGVDSSVLLALMARLRGKGRVPDHTTDLLAYTVRFDGADVEDETGHAGRLADAVGAEFIDVAYGAEDFIRDAGKAVAATDDPVADYAILPTFHLAARAREDVKVVLTGEGGDEFFAGYGRYRAGLRPFFPKAPGRPGPALRSGLLRKEAAAGLRRLLGGRKGLPPFHERIAGRDAALRRLQAYDIAGWLPDDLLVKADRCLMRHGVEGRTPFVDRHLSAFGFHLPASAKIRGRDGKFILKSWLAENLPEADPFTPKRGFTVPVGRWISENAATLGPLVAAQAGIRRIIDADAIPGLFGRADTRAGLLAWRVLYVALWHQIHVLGVDPDQPVADVLAAG